jgi:hypothetical protein
MCCLLFLFWLLMPVLIVWIVIAMTSGPWPWHAIHWSIIGLSGAAMGGAIVAMTWGGKWPVADILGGMILGSPGVFAGLIVGRLANYGMGDQRSIILPAVWIGSALAGALFAYAIPTICLDALGASC